MLQTVTVSILSKLVKELKFTLLSLSNYQHRNFLYSFLISFTGKSFYRKIIFQAKLVTPKFRNEIDEIFVYLERSSQVSCGHRKGTRRCKRFSMAWHISVQSPISVGEIRASERPKSSISSTCRIRRVLREENYENRNVRKPKRKK